MSFRWLNVIDGGGAPIPADQEGTAVDAAKNASTKSADSFIVQKTGLNVVANGVYQFAFSYLYEDPDNPSLTITGPRSPNFTFTLQAPDLTRPVTNLVVTPGLLSYGVKWDLIDKALPDNKWLIDIQIYESLTGAFAGEEYLVWNGNGNSATILVSNTANRWIRVDTRDQDYHKKSVVSGPFKATDPIVVDITGPDNVSSVTTSGGLDTTGIVGFNGYANISWPAITGGGIRGYRIRFRPITTPASSYSYADSPGTGTSYRLAGLGAGLTYEIAVATYDEYNNTSSSYVAGSNVTVGGTPYIASTVDVSGFFRAKANPTDADSTAFKFGFGIETGKRGLLFNASNYWHIDSNQSALFKVGGSTSNYLLWDGAKLTVDGDINAKGGTFSGNIFMSTTGASIYSGTIDTATGNLTGNGFALNSTGLKVANGTNSVTLSAATGTITANAGSISGWNLSGTTLSKNNVILDSNGQIQLGATAATAFYLNTGLVNGGSTWLAWAGNNVPDANAKFRVRSDGTLFVNGAVFGTGTTISGYATTDQLTTTNTNLATTNTNLATTNANLATTNTNVTNANNAIATKLTKSTSTITDSSNNITAINSMGITIFSNGSASATTPGTGARVVMNSLGIAAFNASNQATFSIDASTGNAIFKGDITGASGTFAGSLSGATITGGTININGGTGAVSTDADGNPTTIPSTTSNAFTTVYTRNAIPSLGFNSIAFISINSGGWQSNCYPYLDGTTDLGVKAGANYNTYRWRNARLTNSLILGGNGSTDTPGTAAANPKTVLFGSGAIFADTLAAGAGGSTGGSVIQNSSGYLKVSSSSRKFKENIYSLSKDGYLDALMLVNPVNFSYIGEEEVVSGLIAEELDEIEKFKGVVNYDLQGDPISIAYDRMSSLLVLAIKEIKDKLDIIEQRLDVLEG